VVRLVVDLKQAAQPQVFSLDPVAAYGHRLVFDLYPEKAIDPLEALIAERLRDMGADTPPPKARVLPPGTPWPFPPLPS
jgi:N-acetylmuramoyl-L-alanine amidase